MLRATASLFVILVATGCGPAMPNSTGSVANIEPTMAPVEKTDSKGWNVKCVEDHHLGTRTCRAYTFGSPTGPFQVYYSNDVGPFIVAGLHTGGAIDPTVRVDNMGVWHIPHSAYRADKHHLANAKSLIADLQKGSTAYVTYWTLYGERRMEVSLQGFNEAYAQLTRQKGKARGDRSA